MSGSTDFFSLNPVRTHSCRIIPPSMPSEPLPRHSLRRSCHACARLKRRCDQRLPKCTRCVAKGNSCEYINTPWGLKSRSNSTGLSEHDRKGGIGLTPSLHLEIQKTFSGVIIQFLVDGMRSFPGSFARERKTAFIHPDVYGDMSSGSSCCRGLLEDVHGLCAIYEKGLHAHSMHILRQSPPRFNAERPARRPSRNCWFAFKASSSRIAFYFLTTVRAIRKAPVPC